MSDADVIRRYWDAQDPRDNATLGRMRHPGFEVAWPQSGERIPSHEADALIHEHFPGYPGVEGREFTGAADRWRPSTGIMLGARPVHLTGAGDTWLGQGRLTYGDGSVWHAVMVLELLNGLVHRETTWFAPVREKPPWRQELSQPYEWTAGSDVFESAASPGQTKGRKQAIERYFAGLSSDAATAHEALLHEDATVIMPQSSEQIVGRDQVLATEQGKPNRPSLSVRRILVVGRAGLAEIRMREAEEDAWGIFILEFEGDNVRTLTEYSAPRLDAPEWRAQWVERLVEP